MYLAGAAAVIGERTPMEIAYDDAIVEGLNRGLSLQLAMTQAGAKYPDEALQVLAADFAEMTARYEYLREHARILKLLKKRKKK